VNAFAGKTVDCMKPSILVAAAFTDIERIDLSARTAGVNKQGLAQNSIAKTSSCVK